MDDISTKRAMPFLVHEQRAHVNSVDLIQAFNRYASKIKVLSLGCFDTLLWRKTATPVDVFYEMQQRLAVRMTHFTAEQRIQAEFTARQTLSMQKSIHEINLNDIYQIGFPFFTQSERDTLVEEEIATEMEICYAFPPIIELIRYAHELGIKIIIVSDTYFNENQLKKIVKKVLPDDVQRMINKVICSCDYTKSKTEGLFNHVVSMLALPPQAILHVGHEEVADFDAPRTIGIHAIHLVRYHKKMQEIFRLQDSAVLLLDNTLRNERGLFNFFQGIFASAARTITKPHHVIGYMSLGPLMYVFAHFIHEKVKQIQQTKKHPKIIFLLQDSYLPAVAYEALANESLMEETGSKFVYIDRFAAIAANLRTRQDVEKFLLETVSSWSFDLICNQLLLSEIVSIPLIESIDLSTSRSNQVNQFMKLIQKEAILEIIFEESIHYRKRLKQHLQKEACIIPGDTILFVDINYSPKVHELMIQILQEEMQAKQVVGCYCITDKMTDQTNYCSLIEASSLENQAMAMLLSCINQPFYHYQRVVNYNEEGNLIDNKLILDEEQIIKINAIQSECIRFVKDAKKFFDTTQITGSINLFKDIIFAELIRSTYFTTVMEAEYWQEFQDDGWLVANLVRQDKFKAMINGYQQNLLFKLW